MHARLSAVAMLLATVLPGTALAEDYRVGAGETYGSLCALAASVTFGPGDTIEVADGTYNEACILRGEGTAAAPITLRGEPGARPILSGAGMNLTGAGSVPRAVLQWNGAAYWQVERLELVDAHNDTNNAAGFRLTANSHHISVREMVIHGNDNGVFSDSGAVFTLADSEIYENGAGDGYSHNMYLNGTSVRLVGNHIHDSIGGQNVKLRLHYAELLYNRIVHAGNYEMDFIQSDDSRTPDSHIVLIGNVVVRNPDADNRGQTIVFGSDNGGDAGRTGSVFAFHNTFILTHGSNRLFRALNPGAGESIFFSSNVVYRTADGADLAADAATEALFDGSNNWIVDGMTVPTGLSETVRGADPMFEGAADYRPADGSPLVDAGRDAGELSYEDGDGASQPGAPTMQPAEPVGSAARPVVGAPDVGAYEWGTPPAGSDAGAGDEDAGAPGGDAGAGGGDAGGPGPDGGTAATDEDGGCGCRAAGVPAEAPAGGALILVGTALALRLRRRRR